jgi:hypothetical protein
VNNQGLLLLLLPPLLLLGPGLLQAGKLPLDLAQEQSHAITAGLLADAMAGRGVSTPTGALPAAAVAVAAAAAPAAALWPCKMHTYRQ